MKLPSDQEPKDVPSDPHTSSSRSPEMTICGAWISETISTECGSNPIGRSSGSTSHPAQCLQSGSRRRYDRTANRIHVVSTAVTSASLVGLL